MNKVNLIGRLTTDAELKCNDNNVAYTRFNLAVNRNFINASGEREADFISCLAWRKTAELICNHHKKGSEIAISGRIQTGNYIDKDGNKRYTTDVVVEEITFIGSKKKEETESDKAIETEPDPFADFGNSVSIDDDFLD